MVYGFWFSFYGFGFRVYNTLENSFNIHLSRSYKTLFKML